MKDLLSDPRVRRLLLANITGSIGSGITIIAVPWILVHRSGGDQIYGYVTIFTTLALFIFMPYYGAWIDRHSRKRMLLAGELFGFISTLSMASWALLTGCVETWQLIVSYFSGMLYFTLHYPAKYAFLQQIIDSRHFQSLTGLMEIQGQAASMLAGGLAGILVDRIPLWLILFVDSATYLFSFLVQSTLPYESTHLKHGSPPANAWRSMAEGWRWLHARARLSIYFGCTLVPFVIVMVGNYIFPVYVAGVLRASSSVFGNGEIAFSAGALLAGFMIPRLATERGGDRVIVVTMMFCLVAIALFMFRQTPNAYYIGMGLFGLGNAGSRVARTALMLHTIPNAVMGRVGMFYGLADRLLRTVLISFCTFVVARRGATPAYTGLWLVLLASFIGALATRGSVRAKAAAAAGH